MFGLTFFPDRARGFRELYRTLRPGGTVVVSSWAPFHGIFASIMPACVEVLPDIPFGAGKEPLRDAAEFAAEMSEAGFSDVKVTPVTHSLLRKRLGERFRTRSTLGIAAAARRSVVAKRYGSVR
jgi:SAM-dependent methyltransferase